MTSPIDKQKLFNDMFSLIICVDNYTIQEHYKQLLAEKVWLPYEILSVQFKKYSKWDWKFELAQKEKKEEKISWQPDREKICVSLFWWDLLEKYISNKDLYIWLLEFAKNIWESFEWDLLHKVFVGRDELTSEEKLQLDELQLWWEKELINLNWDEKRIVLIKKLVLEWLQIKLKLILKMPSVGPEVKQKLLTDMKKI